jgi:hypothetical protein
MSEQRSRDYEDVWEAEEQLGGTSEPVVEPAGESPELASAVEDDTLMPDPAIGDEDAEPPYRQAYEPPS